MSATNTQPELKADPPQPADAKDLAAARRKRSLVLALALGAFVILVFIVTLTRLGGAGVSGAP